MGIVLTENMAPGMLLAVDVHERNGRLLLGAGTELTEKHIYIFRTWGVVEADIIGAEEDNDIHTFTNTIEPEVWTAAEAGIMSLFRHTDLAHPCMNQLLHLGVLRKVQHGAL
jgi:hypothetical protein